MRKIRLTGRFVKANLAKQEAYIDANEKDCIDFNLNMGDKLRQRITSTNEYTTSEFSYERALGRLSVVSCDEADDGLGACEITGSGKGYILGLVKEAQRQ